MQLENYEVLDWNRRDDGGSKTANIHITAP